MPGLYPKFRVTRTDPEAQLRHAECQHFVLDVDHDPHALDALKAYAQSVEREDPGLANDLYKIIMDRQEP